MLARRYPIVKHGLIDVVDSRNGLFVLCYTGARANEIDAIGFLEGNSNLGDALRIATSVGRADLAGGRCRPPTSRFLRHLPRGLRDRNVPTNGGVPMSSSYST